MTNLITAPQLTGGHDKKSAGKGGKTGLTFTKVLVLLLLAAVAVASVRVLSPYFSSEEFNRGTIEFLDGRKDTVMALTASSTTASAVISAIPDDTATPIAEKLADISEYFLIVLCVLYAEKYLVTVLSFITFTLIIPALCVIGGVLMFRRSEGMKRLLVKLLVCAVFFTAVIPLSVQVSKLVFNTYDVSINETISAAEDFSNQAEESNEGGSLWENITGAVTSLKDRASRVLNNFVEAVAVMVVTSCVIPIVVVLAFICLIKYLTGADITANDLRRLMRSRTPRDDGTDVVVPAEE